MRIQCQCKCHFQMAPSMDGHNRNSHDRAVSFAIVMLGLRGGAEMLCVLEKPEDGNFLYVWSWQKQISSSFWAIYNIAPIDTALLHVYVSKISSDILCIKLRQFGEEHTAVRRLEQCVFWVLSCTPASVGSVNNYVGASFFDRPMSSQYYGYQAMHNI